MFERSYASLGAEERRAFRLLGAVPGRDISMDGVAALLGDPRPAAELLLAALGNAHLIVERAPGRFAMHDLIRVYARSLLAAEDSDETRRQASVRLADWYFETANAAGGAVVTGIPRMRPAPAPTVSFASLDEGEAWLTAERTNSSPLRA